MPRTRLLAAVAVVVAVVAAIVPATANATPVPKVTGDARVDRLLARMTLDEKLTMLEGTADASADPQYQAGYLPGIPRLGIPSLKLTDGPPGVVTKQDSTGMTATMGVAATFSQHDAQQNGVVIGRDAKALGQDVVLEPFVNMDRDTSWGRGFNTFGEDPLLTSRVGANEITGIQSQGTMAQVKHYIAYDGGNNVNVDEQTLHEIYLAPFDAAINAGVSSVMCSYNVINGYQSCGNAQTLTAILRNELGFKGFVTSDWGANHATTYLNAGLDMEMPGGGFGGLLPQYFSKAALTSAIGNGSIQESRVTEAVGRILYEYDRVRPAGRHVEAHGHAGESHS
jgi:beta-glucosidase